MSCRPDPVRRRVLSGLGTAAMLGPWIVSATARAAAAGPLTRVIPSTGEALPHVSGSSGTV